MKIELREVDKQHLEIWQDSQLLVTIRIEPNGVAACAALRESQGDRTDVHPAIQRATEAVYRDDLTAVIAESLSLFRNALAHYPHYRPQSPTVPNLPPDPGTVLGRNE